MVRAGDLRHTIAIKRYQDVQSSSGEVSKELVTVAKLRAELMRQNGSYVQNYAEKEFDKIVLQFRIRANYSIKDSDLLIYNGQLFKITFIYEDEHEREMQITCEKNNV